MMKRQLLTGLLTAFILITASCVSSENIVNHEKKSAKVFTDHEIFLADKYDTDDVNGFLPEKVYIKTATQTFNKDYQFVLVDGRIYYKGRNEGTGPAEWVLLKGTGKPFHFNNRWPVPDRITEISGDVDSLLAFDDRGRMYEIYFERTTIRKHNLWYRDMGFPAKKQLTINSITENCRSWAVGTRRSEVLWYEDIFGNQHHYGSMGIETFYFLTEDGRSIRFTDSGLPADFSRTILLPERGSFIARKLSASGSTVMLINDAGEIYTRLIDFDTMGCDPMFYKYTYKKEVQPYRGDEYKSNFTAWGLPNEEWAKQPEIKLTGKGAITHHITIVQNGRGNFARELRVGGLSPEGKTGFYYKNLLDEEWKFREVSMRFTAESYLDTETDRAALRGEKQEYSYTGESGKYSLSVPDFVMSEGECTLEITSGEETASVTMHPVEIWSYMFRHDPGLDGTAKRFFVTFSVSELNRQQLSPEFREELDRIFTGKDLTLFSSTAEATENYLHLHIPDTPDGNIDIYLFSSPDMDKREMLVLDSPVLNHFHHKELILKAGTYSIRDRSMIEEKIEKNLDYLNLLREDRKLFSYYSKSARKTSIRYAIFDIISSLTMLDQLNFPKLKTLSYFGTDIISNNRTFYRNIVKNRKGIYKHVEELLELRIDSYKALLKDFDSNLYISELNPYLFDNFEDYMKLAGIPFTPCRDIPYFPGFYIQPEGAEKPMLVEFRDSVEKLVEFAVKEKKDRVKIPVLINNSQKGKMVLEGDTIRIYPSSVSRSFLIEAHLD